MAEPNALHRAERYELGPTPARLAVAAACVAGALLRGWDLGSQVMVGDELHTLTAAQAADAGYIATHNHLPGSTTDYSIPMALWDLLLMRTIGLDEWGMRAFPLVAGVLIVPLLAVLAWRRFGRLEAVVIAWFVALAPVFVLYSRFARPYMVAAFLTAVALASWVRWTRTRGWPAGVAAALSGAIAVWFSLTSAPSVLCVWGLGLLFTATARIRRHGEDPAATRAGARWAVVVLVGCAASAALLYPSLAAHSEFIAGIRARAEPTPTPWWTSGLIAFGTRSHGVLAGLLAITVVGAAIGLRRRPALAATLISMMVAQVAVIQVVAPSGAEIPGIALRYALAALPGVALLTCVGLCALARWLGSATGHAGVVVPCTTAAMLAGIAASGPLPDEFARPNVDTSNMFHYAGATWSLDHARVPGFYRTLAGMDGDVVIAELPWFAQWRHYQDVHRKRLKTVGDHAGGIGLQAAIPLQSLLSGIAGIDYVVVHKDAVREWFHVTGRDELQPDDSVIAAARSGAAAVIAACRASESLRETYDDAWITVFAGPSAR